ncbi:MAG: YdcF family protein [Vicinamibacterales bacterium]
MIAALAAAAACTITAGRMLVDPRALETPAPADVIFVLSGGLADRWLEAYDLWREKRAPLILISRGYPGPAGVQLRRRGIHLPDEAEIAHDVMVRQMGVPASAVEVLQGPVDTTAAEAQALRRVALARGWRSAIIVTSLPHTRRTALAMRRALDDAGIGVQVRGSRYDAFRPARWWRDRGSARWVVSELPKLVAYRLGLGQ